MKKILLLFLLMAFTACSEKQHTKAEQITAYYEGFKNADYKQIKRTLADSLITTEGDYIMAFSREGYYEKFRWDSVFKPVYKLVSIENRKEDPIATITIRSLKHEFLENSPMTCSYRFHFESGKIAKIENLECPDANWETWAEQVDTLVNWVKLNRPELDGFIHDLTMKGAIDYVNAMALYNQQTLKATE